MSVLQEGNWNECLGSRSIVSPDWEDAEILGCEHAEGPERVSSHDCTGIREAEWFPVIQNNHIVE